MRIRPTLPLKPQGGTLSASDLDSGMKLPLYSCPFDKCCFHTNDRGAFLHHISGGVKDSTHSLEISKICKDDMPWMTATDYVYGAIGVAERERWPLVGLSTTRRCLNLLALRYNDTTTKCLACFICGQLRTTCGGYPQVDLQSKERCDTPSNEPIGYWKEAALQDLEKQFPGTLLNNCGFDLWEKKICES